MKHEVIVSPRAVRDLEAAYQRLARETPQHAPTWHNELLDAMISLEDNPGRCPIYRKTRRGIETRQLLFGGKRHAYRLIFAIRGGHVEIAHIRHAARR